ncbi:MAG TPA: acyltransferase [Thermoanaerobaculia bacterium]|nr:acyltransferase [Thermoanaerobaculia bacterium]
MHAIRGVAAALYLALNTIVCASVLLPLALVKLGLPFDAVRRIDDPALNAIAERWIRNNALLMRGTAWDVRGLEGLERRQWYLVEANHQSWADILVLQKLLTGRIPLLKFFLKQELIWVPLIGLAWWALDFPFMKRHSQEFLRKHPERRGDDLAAIRRSCGKFALIPTSVMNFVEGTRFTPAKQREQESPYRHLLRPKAGGIALALGAMGDRFHSLLDVTIHYPAGAPSFFDLLSGRMKRVVVRVRELPIPPDLIGRDYAEDAQFKRAAQKWLGAIWEEKDDLLEELQAERA